jgi:hypothetical protein
MTVSFLFIPIGKQFQKISLASLVYIQRISSGTKWVTTKEIYTSILDFSQIQPSLPAFEFCKVNECYLIALASIISFDNKFVQLPGLCITLDKKFVQVLKDRINIIEPASSSSLVVTCEGLLVSQ